MTYTKKLSLILSLDISFNKTVLKKTQFGVGGGDLYIWVTYTKIIKMF